MSETLAVDTWLATVLADVAPGGVYADVAPPDVDEPYIVFSLSDATDVKVVGAQRVLTDVTYLVKAVQAGSSFVALDGIADGVDEALDNANGVTTSGVIIWCTRERPVRYSEVTDGVTYKHLGALYRIQARKE